MHTNTHAHNPIMYLACLLISMRRSRDEDVPNLHTQIIHVSENFSEITLYPLSNALNPSTTLLKLHHFPSSPLHSPPSSSTQPTHSASSPDHPAQPSTIICSDHNFKYDRIRHYSVLFRRAVRSITPFPNHRQPQQPPANCSTQ